MIGELQPRSALDTTSTTGPRTPLFQGFTNTHELKFSLTQLDGYEIIKLPLKETDHKYCNSNEGLENREEEA